MAQWFSEPKYVFVASITLHAAFLIYGQVQDRFSPVKYTDIDYLVFTDAARFVVEGKSPYERETYRYTPLLAWILTPNVYWFEFGKVIFSAGDVLAGWLIYRIFRSTYQLSREQAARYASVWLLNPFVIQISTRGSSEGLLCALVMSILWAACGQKHLLAGTLLSLAVHFKIYPFIYAPSIIWSMTGSKGLLRESESKSYAELLILSVRDFFTTSRLKLVLSSFSSYVLLNYAMYYIYGWPYLEESYLYHFTRLDHRHNFSVYNTLLHLSSSPEGSNTYRIESFAFLPQLVCSAVAIPLALAKRDLPSTMFAQTLAFVTFNKVCTSQYFIWYMVFFPFYLRISSARHGLLLGGTALGLWVVGQAMWLQRAYRLEFLGQSTFVPSLWLASIAFFAINIWILGLVCSDVGSTTTFKSAPRVNFVGSKQH